MVKISFELIFPWLWQSNRDLRHNQTCTHLYKSLNLLHTRREEQPIAQQRSLALQQRRLLYLHHAASAELHRAFSAPSGTALRWECVQHRHNCSAPFKKKKNINLFLSFCEQNAVTSLRGCPCCCWSSSVLKPSSSSHLQLSCLGHRSTPSAMMRRSELFSPKLSTWVVLIRTEFIYLLEQSVIMNSMASALFTEPFKCLTGDRTP